MFNIDKGMCFTVQQLPEEAAYMMVIKILSLIWQRTFHHFDVHTPSTLKTESTVINLHLKLIFPKQTQLGGAINSSQIKIGLELITFFPRITAPASPWITMYFVPPRYNPVGASDPGSLKSVIMAVISSGLN